MARGVSPYLPLNLAPDIERKIEQVLILADKPITRRPIAAAIVFDALPKACAVDSALCEEVHAYLRRYMHDSGVTLASVELAASSGHSNRTIPNAHGMQVDSPWQFAASAYYQMNDYALFNAGGIAYQGRATPTGTLASFGFDFAQLDIGYRDHWFSPLTDSSSLISTEAPTMPSVTLSNYAPITLLGLNYEAFFAEMSKQDGIAYQGGTTSGRPRLSGLQLGIEPVSGYSLNINRVLQFGGGARGYGGVSGLIKALYRNPNTPDTAAGNEFGNQVASITSSIVFPGSVPFAMHIEYAGEDNAYAGRYRLGDTNLSLGLDFPKLWSRFDLGYEISEWQSGWYVHHLYPEGLTNEDHVIGHWFGDERSFGDAIPGRSQMLRLGWRPRSGDYLSATYRSLSYEPFSSISYKRLQELGVAYSTIWRGHTIGAELYGGRDVFGESFARLAASFDLASNDVSSADSYAGGDAQNSGTEVFVDLGTARSHAYLILGVDIPNVWTPQEYNVHAGIGARRPVSEHNDLGARVEFDKVYDHDLLSVRALDYRYRWNQKIAVGGFFGFGRYDYGLPSYGYYWGGGVQLMDLLPKWDLSFDIRHHEKLGRDKMLASDPPITPDRTRIFFDINSTALYLSRRF